MAKLNQKIMMELETKMVESKLLKLKVGTKTFEVRVEKKFLNTKIESLIKEALEFKKYIVDNDIRSIDNSTILFILLFKNFTDIPYEEYKTIDERCAHYVQFTNGLKNLECEDGISIFEKVADEFEDTQIRKIVEKMNNANKNMTEFIADKQAKLIVEEAMKLIAEEDLAKNIVGDLISKEEIEVVSEDASI